MELDVRVERNELLQGHLSDAGDEVPTHGQQEDRVAERQGGRRTASEGDAHAHHVTEVHVLREIRVDWKKRHRKYNYLNYKWKGILTK